jgi:hypothetical protein
VKLLDFFVWNVIKKPTEEAKFLELGSISTAAHEQRFFRNVLVPSMTSRVRIECPVEKTRRVYQSQKKCIRYINFNTNSDVGLDVGSTIFSDTFGAAGRVMAAFACFSGHDDKLDAVLEDIVGFCTPIVGTNSCGDAF